MLDSTVKRFILPFSNPEASKNSFSAEVEAAAVFAIAESDRKKGGGFVLKQPEEKLLFIAKIGYPLWLFSRNETTFVFDGLNNSSSTLSFNDVPAIKEFMENLDKSSKTIEGYLAFLSDNLSYFQDKQKEKKIPLPGLITDYAFHQEFNSCRKEFSELTSQAANLALLPPVNEESRISSFISEVEMLRAFYKKETEILPECLKLVNNITNQYMTELSYASSAIKDEFDAKVRATEELIDPQIAKLNKEYNNQINNLAKNFDDEIQELEKQKNKTEKLMESTEAKIKEYLKQARIHASKNHTKYEKRWKEKSNRTKKVLSEFRNQREQTENKIKNLKKQKISETFKLDSERDLKIKDLRRPIVELETSRESRMTVSRQEAERLTKKADPIIEAVSATVKPREAVLSKFEALGIKLDQQMKGSALFYIPFYIACYQTKSSERYLVFPPSKISSFDFAAKLKGTFGMSKIKDLLVPRFDALTSLVTSIPRVVEQSSLFESQIKDVGAKTSLTANMGSRELISKGLVYLKHEGWLSEKEHQVLANSLASF